MKRFTIIITSIIAVVLIILGVIYGTGFLQRVTADFRGETKQIEQTKASGEYRISAYDQFYDKCAGVRTLESKIANMERELEDTEEAVIIQDYPKVLSGTITVEEE